MTADPFPAWHGPFPFAGLPYVTCPAGDGRIEAGQLVSVDARTGTLWHDYCAMRHVTVLNHFAAVRRRLLGGSPRLTTIDFTCARPYPPNHRLTCVRVAGHRGRHVWLSDDETAYASSSITWRDHADECGCCYCTDAPASRAAAAALAP